MMLYVLLCTDKPDNVELRQQVRPDHLAYLEKLGGQVKGAGPFVNAAGVPTGSMILLEAGTQAEAERMAADDPYARAGLFADVTIRPWKWLINKPDGL